MSNASKKVQDSFTAVGLPDDATKLHPGVLTHSFILLFGEKIQMLGPKCAIDSDDTGKLFDRPVQYMTKYLEKGSTETAASPMKITTKLREIYNTTTSNLSY